MHTSLLLFLSRLTWRETKWTVICYVIYLGRSLANENSDRVQTFCCQTLKIMRPDGEYCTSHWFHMDYFIKEYLFSIWLHLKVDISSFPWTYSHVCVSVQSFGSFLWRAPDRYKRLRLLKAYPVCFLFFILQKPNV